MAEATQRLDRIAAEAKKLQFGRAVLTIVLTPFYVIGWIAGRTWQAVAHLIAAAKIGWREGNGH